MAQSISKKRPARFVILSPFASLRVNSAKDLSRRTEILSAAKDDRPDSAAFDAHIVFFEMDWGVAYQAKENGGFEGLE